MILFRGQDLSDRVLVAIYDLNTYGPRFRVGAGY